MKIVIVTFLILFAQISMAEKSSGPSGVSYDLGAAFGTYKEESIAEINLGLNWYVLDWMSWRNAVFTRFGSPIETVAGLDTSVRFLHSLRSSGGNYGLDAFIGPGLRFASQNSNAVFGEAGAGVKLGSFYLGLGTKVLFYSATRKDRDGQDMPKQDQQFFLILASGGFF